MIIYYIYFIFGNIRNNNNRKMYKEIFHLITLNKDLGMRKGEEWMSNVTWIFVSVNGRVMSA